MQLPDNTLVTGRTGHEIYVLRAGNARWIPDSWTMHAEGLSPRDLVILPDLAMEQIVVGAPLPTRMPSPVLSAGTIVETESGIWEVVDGLLEPVADLLHLRAAAYDPARLVVWLPDSILRSVRRSAADPPARLGSHAAPVC